jgi:hypothetical protein
MQKLSLLPDSFAFSGSERGWALLSIIPNPHLLWSSKFCSLRSTNENETSWLSSEWSKGSFTSADQVTETQRSHCRLNTLSHSCPTACSLLSLRCFPCALSALTNPVLARPLFCFNDSTILVLFSSVEDRHSWSTYLRQFQVHLERRVRVHRDT